MDQDSVAGAPRRTPNHSMPSFLAQRTPLFIILTLLLATTILGCSTGDPSPTPNLEATVQARMQSARNVEDSVKATVEANKPIAQAVQATLEARAQATPAPTTRRYGSQLAATPTPIPLIPLANQTCDEILQEHLVYQTAAADAYTMQGVIRQIQAGIETCPETLWNPKIVDPQRNETGTCLSLIKGLDPSRLPPGLLTPDGTAPRPTSGRDHANNVIAYWSHVPEEKPSDLSNCWVYLSGLTTWLTGQDLQADTTTISHIDLKQGDCLTFAETRTDADLDPAKVPCEGEWTHRVVNLFETTDPGYYPTIRYFQEQAFLNCSPRYTFFIRPLEPSWLAGNRHVTCLQDRFGLSLTDPSKLDRMISVPYLQPSDCFNQLPDVTYQQVEVVPCSDSWESRLLNTFQAADSTEYPPDLRLYRESTTNCDRRTTDPSHPTPDAWNAGYRTVQCFQQNLTGEPGIPEILDRLVHPHSVNPGECFNTHRTTLHFLAELTPCTGNWEFQATRKVQVPGEGPYPGDQLIRQTIQQECDPDNYPKFLATSETAWNEGHSNVICLIEGNAPPSSNPAPSEPEPTAETTLDQGIALAQAGQYQKALTALQNAQRLFGGTSALSETWMGFVHEYLGNYPTAIEHHSKAISLDDTATYRIARANALFTSNDCPSAEADARIVLRRTPQTFTAFHSHVEAHWLLALCLTDDQEALSHAREAHRGAQSNAYPQGHLDELTTLIKELNEATLNSFRIGPPSSNLTNLTSLSNARWLAQTHPQIADRLASLPWTADGLSGLENSLIEQLLYLYVENTTPAAISLLEMPFLESVTPGDLEAVRSLKDINRQDAPSFHQILNHPTFSAGGISDAWTPIVATLESANRYNKTLLPVLLDPAQAHIQTRTIHTPLRGSVALHIVRMTTTYDPESLDRLEHAVKNAEAFMAEPFPTDMVALLYADTVKGSYAGHNSGASIVILPKYDLPDQEYAQKITDHEVAHYYWTGNEQWIDEGMSEFMASTFLAHRRGTRVLPDNKPCHPFKSISQIPNTETTHTCSYSLGERLFIDLHDTVGREEFRTTMSAFYRDSPAQSIALNQLAPEKGITHIRTHFPSPAAQQVIDRWYNRSSPYRTDLYDTDPVDPRLSVLNASISEASLKINDRPVSSFSARSNRQPVSLHIQYQHPNPVGTPGLIPISLAIFYEDGHPYFVDDTNLNQSRGETCICVG